MTIAENRTVDSPRPSRAGGAPAIPDLLRHLAHRWVHAVLLLGCLLFAAPADATTLSDLAATMKPGQWLEVNTNGFGNGDILVPPGGSGSLLEYMDEVQRNPLTKKFYIIGCARASEGNGSYECSDSSDEDAGWVEYDEVANSWKKMPTTPFNIYPHSYDHAAMDPATGDYYFRVHGRTDVWRYSAGQWGQIPPMPTSGPDHGAIEFFPELGGLVFVNGREDGGKFYLYKRGADGWITLPGGVPMGRYGNATEYSPIHKILYIAGGQENGDYPDDETRVLQKMDASGKITRAPDAPVLMGHEASGVAVHTIDPITGNFLVFSVNGRSYEYNPATNKWAEFSAHPLTRSEGSLRAAAVPIWEYGVIFVVKHDPGYSGKVYLYKHSSGTPPPPDTVPPARPSNLKVQ